MAQQPQNSQPVSQPQQVRNDAAALDAAFPTRRAERRQTPRLKYQVVATLEPVASGPDDVCVVTRDAWYPLVVDHGDRRIAAIRRVPDTG